MQGRGWAVNRTEYDPDREIYTWRHQLGRGASRALRISREVLELYPGFAVAEHLRRLRVAQALHAQPHRRWVIVQRGSAVELVENQ
jgi:hypothetical protein